MSIIQGGKGRLIAFEGIDGTGKSTQIGMLADTLRNRGYEVVITREPTNGIYGRRIRELYVSRHTVSLEEELELFLADRREHVEKLIAPALAGGKIVLTDRYYLSTVAYQGGAGLAPELIMRKNEEFAPEPDLAILIDLPPRQAVARIQHGRGESLNDFEQEANLAEVARLFHAIDRQYIRWVDGEQGIYDVQQRIMGEVEKILPKKDQYH